MSISNKLMSVIGMRIRTGVYRLSIKARILVPLIVITSTEPAVSLQDMANSYHREVL